MALVIGLLVARSGVEQGRLYEAKSEFTMDVRCPQAGKGIGVVSTKERNETEENFNTRISDWQSEEFFTKVVACYYTDYKYKPDLQSTDEALSKKPPKTRRATPSDSRLTRIPRGVLPASPSQQDSVDDSNPYYSKRRGESSLRDELLSDYVSTPEMTDKEMHEALREAKLEFVPHSRLVTISVKAKTPRHAADLANAYAKTIEAFTDEANKKRCDWLVAPIHKQVEKQKSIDDALANRLRKYKIDVNGQNDIQAEAGLKILEREKRISGEIFQRLLEKEKKTRIVAEKDKEFVRVRQPAQIPAKPVDKWTGRYEAKSEFTYDTYRSQGNNSIGVDYEEVLNTWISIWRSEAVYKRIIQVYRATYPNFQSADKELYTALTGAKMELVPRSRRVTIAIRSKDPVLAAALANAYTDTIKAFTDEANKKRCDKAVALIHQQVERQLCADNELTRRLFESLTKHKNDSIETTRTILNQLEEELEESSVLYQQLLLKEYEARISAEQNNLTIREGRPAQIPIKPLPFWRVSGPFSKIDK